MLGTSWFCSTLKFGCIHKSNKSEFVLTSPRPTFSAGPGFSSLAQIRGCLHIQTELLEQAGQDPNQVGVENAPFVYVIPVNTKKAKRVATTKCYLGKPTQIKIPDVNSRHVSWCRAPLLSVIRCVFAALVKIFSVLSVCDGRNVFLPSSCVLCL